MCAATKHGPACRMAFGRLSPAGDCERCDELREGAPARDGWQRGYFAKSRREETQRAAAIAAHFAPGGPHSQGKCGPVCTAFDW